MEVAPCAGTSTIPAKLAIRLPSSPALSSATPCSTKQGRLKSRRGVADETVADVLLRLDRTAS